MRIITVIDIITRVAAAVRAVAAAAAAAAAPATYSVPKAAIGAAFIIIMRVQVIIPGKELLFSKRGEHACKEEET